MKTIYLGTDHAGFKLKEYLKKYLEKLNYKVIDLGNRKYIKTDDYPDYAKKVAKAVARNNDSRGILFCHNGVGMCIVANKIAGIRAALVSTPKVAKEAVFDDNANIICLGGGYLKLKAAEKIVISFLQARFSEAARHKRRIKKIKKLEVK